MGQIIFSGEIPTASIKLQTKLGNDIENCQPAELSAFILNQIADIPKKFPNMRIRSGANAAYNCHGFMFGSRRTCIENLAEIPRILQEDGYTEIPTDQVLPGDVIVYYDDVQSPEHSGVVVREPAESNLNIPLVCSKWGGFGEVVHDAHYGPYAGWKWRFYRIL